MLSLATISPTVAWKGAGLGITTYEPTTAFAGAAAVVLPLDAAARTSLDAILAGGPIAVLGRSDQGLQVTQAAYIFQHPGIVAGVAAVVALGAGVLIGRKSKR